MRLATFRDSAGIRIGVERDGRLIDLTPAATLTGLDLPPGATTDMLAVISGSAETLALAAALVAIAPEGTLLALDLHTVDEYEGHRHGDSEAARIEAALAARVAEVVYLPEECTRADVAMARAQSRSRCGRWLIVATVEQLAGRVPGRARGEHPL